MTVNGHSNGVNGAGPSTLSPLQVEPSSVEAARILPQALELVQNFIASGEQPDTYVAPWGSIPDFRKAVSLSLPDKTASDDALLDAIKLVFDNSVNPWTGRFLDKLYAAPTPVGIAADLVLSAVNANAHVMSASPVLSLAEERCVEGLCELFGFTEKKADGLTMPGGSSANTLAVQTALANLFPKFRTQGMLGVMQQLTEEKRAPRPLLFTSSQSHYSLDKAAISSGLGLDSVVKVDCDDAGRMDPKALDHALTAAKEQGTGTPFLINATSGTTVLGSFDPLPELSAVARKHNCWLHIDGSWGGPIVFSHRQTYSDLMKGSHLADSITINPHKLLNVPLQCSFLLVRDADTLSANSLDAAYLFHSKDRRENAAMKTMGCGRRGDALKFWLYWVRYGKNGFGAHVDAGLALAIELVEYIRSKPTEIELGPLADPLFLQICFRPLQPGRVDDSASWQLDAEEVKKRSAATQHVYQELKTRRMFAVDFAPLPNGIGDYIRLVVHPRTKMEDLKTLVDQVAEIGQSYWKQQA
ncbi:Pyridoxal phosphate-dependent decarboxylase [Kalmanozyma brasiliensis GHG001]|uniref:Glutamate decarboxylase n=1 Tax=Kalmanozyma brasiliensis (strain GHG001) TaxID=1365824 RepID=V5ES93_KALBG|nr:Pyridoxal phosphate-dependent decarboxylase [Kalmanozyma brasiliensis GHG001]EST04749.1 Pyridoxal phosphate-dependent decarboxylase [Kalmanozyma brasiliensis GHG001]